MKSSATRLLAVFISLASILVFAESPLHVKRVK